MVTTLMRLFFVAAILLMIVIIAAHPERIQIDTSLQDLNPESEADQGVTVAKDTLLKDISQRFIVVIKAEDEKTLAQATSALKKDYSAIPELSLIMADTQAQDYLQALAPYKYALLTSQQKERLLNKSAEELARQAQQKLYQIGNGVRLVPFEEDPLGWYSDFVLQHVQDFSINDDSQHAQLKFNTITVLINTPVEGLAAQENLYERINEVKRSVESAYSVTILQSGMFFFAVDSAQSAKGDIQLIAIGSVLGILVLMLLVFRSLLPLTLSITSIVIGVSFGIFVNTMVFGGIHIFTIVFGASLIGIVVDYSLHYFYHFLVNDKQHLSQPTRDKSKSTLHRAMFLSMLTSLIGYGALALSDLVLLQKVALFSCSGLLLAWMSVMVLGPFIAKRPITARQTLLMSVVAGVRRLFATKQIGFVAVGLGISIAATVWLYTTDVDINDDPRRFFMVSEQLLNNEQEVAALAQVYEPGRYFIVHGKAEADVYSTLKRFYQSVGESRQYLTSVLDWLPSSEEQIANHKLQEKLYQEDGVLARFYERLGMDPRMAEAPRNAWLAAREKRLNFDNLRQSLPALPPLWVEYNNTIYSFVLLKKGSDLNTLSQASEGLDNIEYSNALGSAIEALADQREKGLHMLLLAYVLLAVMLLVTYRKTSAVALLLIPICASALAIAALVALQQPITIFHIMALFLVLGLGMDYLIFAREMVEKADVTQQAILLSAMTSLLSFGLLAFSDMPAISAFGSTILIGNSINFVAAISLFNHTKDA
ncbi:hypothetical protein DRW07_16030 [Alteromonas sediminis]|uniref:Membrane transport protein MMPL domain-containing protein n=1 Tax=Alteromonas sediminis TaxID=2259342 RepID=A0A3N5XXZ0_9ALTE|nr:MMPL family transporter [Alteromonas sediminis]RPJ65410.1 hypothetical protein DRW07_16030 [Alteromonas sediminis]